MVTPIGSAKWSLTLPNGRSFLARICLRDLEAICLKSLEKEPSQRYATAGELAADLRRFLAGEPTRARPSGAGDRIWKWTRRQPAAAALVAVSVTATALLVAALTLYSINVTAAYRLAEKHRLNSEARRLEAEALRREAIAQRREAESRRAERSKWFATYVARCT